MNEVDVERFSLACSFRFRYSVMCTPGVTLTLKPNTESYVFLSFKKKMSLSRENIEVSVLLSKILKKFEKSTNSMI